MRDGPVPDGWRMATVGEVAEVVGGCTPSTRVPSYWGGDICWATPTDITGLKSRYISETATKITEEGLKSAGLRLLPPRSILVTSRATVGACAISTVPVSTNQGFASLVCKDGIEPEFLYYHISARQRELARLSAGSTFTELPRRAFRKLPLLLPPLPEQRKITEILSSVDDAIERTEAVIEQVRRVKQGLAHMLLTGRVRVAPGLLPVTRDGAVPDGWRRVPFSALAEVNPRRAIPVGAAVPYVDMASVREQARGISNVAQRVFTGSGSRFRRGDTLFARITPCAENRKIAFVDCLHDGAVGFGSTEFIVLGPRPMFAHPNFVYYLASWDPVVEFAVSRMAGTSGRQRVPEYVFREELYVLAPPLPEQRKIAEILSSVDDAIERTEAVIEQVRRVKQGLMHVLLTGQVRVRVEV